MMIKLIQASTLEELEQFTNNWICDNENDNREIQVVSSAIIPVNEVSSIGLNGQQQVKTTFNNWLVYKLAYVGV